jgi:iron complex transport system permease protein
MIRTVINEKLPLYKQVSDSASKQHSEIFLKSHRRFKFLILGLFITLFVSVTLAVTIGPVKIHSFIVWKIVLYKITGIQLGNWTKPMEQIVWFIRFPRVLLAIIIGGGLSVIGVTMQAMVRNPLASPYILGISSGASLGISLVIIFGVLSFAGSYGISLAAFLGSLGAFGFVFLLAENRGRLTNIRLVLTGIAISSMCSALTSFLTYLAPDHSLRQVVFWMLGSLGGAKWENLPLPSSILLAGTIYLILQARSLNVLIMGEETANTLGIDTNRFRKKLFVTVSLLGGVLVAVSGVIGFVGLMMPHIVRLIVGTDHRRVLPTALLVGAIYLIWVDVIARTVLHPVELPIGIITSIIGAPFFLYLMWRNMKKGDTL